MKPKIVIIGVFLLSLAFIFLNMSWAHGSEYGYQPNRSYNHSSSHKGHEINHRAFIPLTKEQRRFEKAKRIAWADGRLTYKEMRRLHEYEKKAIKSLHRSKHDRVPYHRKKRGHISSGHKWNTFPKFSIRFSF